MEMKKQCIECKTEILFTKKDIKPVPKWKKEEIGKRNKQILDMVTSKKKTFWGKKVDRYGPWASIQLLNEIREVYGYIQCPVCKTKQMITNK